MVLTENPSPIETHNSPFRPGFGTKPLVFGGHRAAIEELSAVFQTMDFGDSHSVLISGLRGAGKTSMLALLREEAEQHGWLVISDNASDGLLRRVMDSTIPRLVDALDDESKVRLKSVGVWQFSASWEVEHRRREVKPLLRHELVALSEALDARGVLITIDEVSAGKSRLRELSSFALELAHALEAGVNLMVVFAGIKVDLNELLRQEHTTFLRRSRELDFWRLTPAETEFVLTETIRIGGRAIDRDAVTALTCVSQGYPYLVQLAGDYAWRNSPGSPRIDLADAHAAQQRSIDAVLSRVIDRVYLDLSEADQAFVRAMAQDEDASSIADIGSRMSVSAQYAQVYKRRLIDSGYVVQDGRGHVSFALPYLREYLRSMTDLTPRRARQADPWAEFPAPAL
jgi:hypothetical protein